MYRDLFMTEEEELKARIEAAKKDLSFFSLYWDDIQNTDWISDEELEEGIIVLDDSISNCLLKLQNNRAASLAELLDDSIGFLLEYSGYFYDNSKTFLDILATLHNARTEFLGLIPNQKGGAQ